MNDRTRIYTDPSCADFHAAHSYDNDRQQWYYYAGETENTKLANSEQPMTNPMLQEHDMTIIPDLLQRIANTIVAASSFAKDVDKMRGELSALSADLEATRNTNTMLQETIDTISQQRDEARREAKEAVDGRIRVETDLLDLVSRYDRSEREGAEMAERNAELRKERDDALFKALELEEALSKANAKLARFRAVMADDEQVSVPPAPSPEPAPAPEVSQVPEAPQGYVPFSEPSAPTVEETSTPASASDRIVDNGDGTERVYPPKGSPDWYEKAKYLEGGDNWYYTRPRIA